MSTNNQTQPIPYDSPIAFVDLGQGRKAPAVLNVNDWDPYFRAQRAAVINTAQQLKRVTLAGQSASIAPTAIPTGLLAAGLYRVNVYFRLVQAATVNSSLAINIAFTDKTIACQIPGTAYTGNVVNRPQTLVLPVRIDQATSITYETVYASVGATPMKYDFELILEALPS